MEDGAVWVEGPPTIEVPTEPAARIAPPIDRILRMDALSPLPTLSVPQLGALITIVVHEGRELRLRDGCTGDGEGLDLDQVRPFLVIEDERFVRRSSQEERAAGHKYVARQRAADCIVRPYIAQTRPRAPQRLPRLTE